MDENNKAGRVTDMELRIEYLPIEQITPYENNARKHQDADVDAIVASIDEFGFDDPIGVWGGHNVIVEGHGRLLAAKKLGMETVPVIHLDHLTDEQRRAYALAHNRTAELSEWDEVAKELELSGISEIDMSLFGFDLSALDEEGETVEDDYDIDSPVEARAKLGDVWQLGNHLLMCGDSTDINVVSNLMNGEMADITITSPPYGMSDNAHLRKNLRKGYSGRDGSTFYKECRDLKSEWPDLMDGFMDAACAVSHAQFINIMMVGDNKKALVDFVYKRRDNLVDVIVWNKHTCPPQIHENVLNNGYEFVFIFDNDNGTRKIRYGDFKGTQSNYIETERQQNKYADIHKAVFGTKFVEKLLQINGKAKTVFDPFGGTGTTLIVCEQMGCKCYMMELDPHYVDVIIARWEELTGQKAQLISEA